MLFIILSRLSESSRSIQSLKIRLPHMKISCVADLLSLSSLLTSGAVNRILDQSSGKPMFGFLAGCSLSIVSKIHIIHINNFGIITRCILALTFYLALTFDSLHSYFICSTITAASMSSNSKSVDFPTSILCRIQNNFPEIILHFYYLIGLYL